MKLFQKSALAVAIAAVPFLSVNAMEALDDATLSEMTGQAGVTIEQSLNENGITIGSIEYTDTGAGNNGGGHLVIGGNLAKPDGSGTAGIIIQGWNPLTNQASDSISRQTIDINEQGDLVTNKEQINAFGGEVIPMTGQRIQVGHVNLANADKTNQVSLVSDLDMVMLNGSSAANIINLAGTNSTRADLNAIDVGNTGVTVDASAADGNIAIVTSSKSAIQKLDVKALDGAVEITGLSYKDTRDQTNNPYGLMSSTQVIWAKSNAGSVDSGQVDGNGDPIMRNLNGVYIEGSDSVGTLAINSIAIGGGVIGAVTITDISQKGSVTRIYGH